MSVSALARLLLISLLLPPLLPSPAAAERIEPSPRVRSRVVVRAQATRLGADVGSLRPGHHAELIESREGWHHVILADGTPGFVNAGWTRVIPDAEPQPEVEITRYERDPSSSFLAGIGSGLRSLLFRGPEVDFVIREPVAGRTVRRHYDPSLPVAGFATSHGADGNFDVMLVIDTSASTSEWAETDVDGDGESEDTWQGDDSILRAEMMAAARFVEAARRLPGNRAGQRIRIGIVTFAGDDVYHRRPQDRRFDATPAAIRELALRDARLHLPLTHDYDAVDEVLAGLEDLEPSGMTNFAAGIARAILAHAAFGPEPEGTPPPRDAIRVIHFLTDGQPRLPYDRKVAERVARRAADEADRVGIQINSFALGRNAVTGSINATVKRIPRKTGGRFVAIEDPGDIVPILAATSFSFVDRVKLINRTTQRETDYIGTGIDGSFYGEILLEEGENEIELVAVLHDDREARRTLRISYTQGPPDQELIDELEKIRAQNEALVGKIKLDMARQIQAEREERARGRIQISAEDAELPPVGAAAP